MTTIVRQKKINIFEDKDIIEVLLRQKKIILFLDFDGTLAAIVEHYKSATILKESKLLLEKIAKNRDCLIAIVSGRALADVKKRVGLRHIMYSGNHGLEVQGPGIKYSIFVKSGIKKLISNIKRQLIKNIRKIRGVLIEDKKLTISVHYRNVMKADMAILRALILKSVSPFRKYGDIRIDQGKKIIEIKPNVRWDKGKVTLWLIDNFRKRNSDQKIYPIFIGDDVTDETAFKALKKKGLCIRVGASQTSAAPFYLKDIKQVTRFLKTILESKAQFKENSNG